MRPRLLTQRWREAKQQTDTMGTATAPPLQHVQSTPSLRITPIQISKSHKLTKTKWYVNRDGVSSSDHFWATNVDGQGQGDFCVHGTAPDYRCTRMGGYTSYHWNDSDVSDQERGNTLPARASEPLGMDLRPGRMAGYTAYHSNESDVSDQETENNLPARSSQPQGMDLRPEPFDSDPDLFGGEAAGEGLHAYAEVLPRGLQVYPEVLPGPLKWLNMSLSISSTDETEDMAWTGEHVQDPSIPAIVSRLIELERLQAATVLRERVRTGRTRPATAVPIVRCCSRPRKPDPSDPQSEFSGRGECRSAVSVFMDVAPLESATVTSHKTARSVRTKHRSKVSTPKQPTVPVSRPCSCPNPKTEKLVPVPSSGSMSAPVKSTPRVKTKPLKTPKKKTSRKARTDFTKGHKSKS